MSRRLVLILALCVLLGLPVVVRAQGEVEIDRDEYIKKLWVASLLQRSEHNPQIAMEAIILHQLYSKQPDLHPNDARTALALANQEWQKLPDDVTQPERLLRTMTSLLNLIPGWVTPPFIEDAIKDKLEAGLDSARALNQLDHTDNLYTVLRTPEAVRKISELYDIGHGSASRGKNRLAEQAIDFAFEGPLGLPLSTDDEWKFYDRLPQLYIPDLVRVAGDDRIRIINLERAQLTFRDRLEQVRAEGRAAAQEAKANADSAAEQAKKLAARQEKFEAARSVTFLLSSLISKKDPRAGQALAKIGNATIDLALTISKYAGKAITAFSAAAMTGGVAGVAFAVLSVFESDAPSADAMILEQLVALRDDLNNLRVEMHDRFDRIDVALNSIFDELTRRFAKIDFELGLMRDDLHDAQHALLDTQRDVHRVLSYLNDALVAGFNQSFHEAANRYLGIRERAGVDLTFPEFLDAEARFSTHGLNHAGDGTRAPIFSPAPGQLADELKARPLAQNINVVNEVTRTLLGVPTGTGTLSNPLEYSLAVDAYSRLMNENPQWASRLSGERKANLVQTGRLVQNAANRLAAADVFAAARTYYAGRLQTAKQEVDRVVTRMLADPSRLTPGLDPWGGTSQPSPPNSPSPVRNTSINGCDGTHYADYVEAPSAYVPNEPLFRLAAVVGLGTVTTCIEQARFDHPPDTGNIGTFTMRLVVQWAPREVGPISKGPTIISYQDASVPGIAIPGTLQDPISLIGRCWNQRCFAPTERLKILFEAHSRPTAVATLDPLYGELHSLIGARLAADQVMVNEAIAADLDVATQLRAAVHEVAGAKSLIDALVSLALPRALANDDELRTLLFGTERLLSDGQHVATLFLAASRAGQSGTPAEKVDIAGIGNARLARFQTAISAVLTAIEQGRTSAGIPLLDNALARLSEPAALPITRLLSVSGAVFGPVRLGTTASRPFILTNTGNTTMTVSGITVTGPFRCDGTVGVIPPGGSLTVSLVFIPTTAGRESGVVTVHANHLAGSNSVIASGIGTLTGRTGDFDGDGRHELAVFRPSNGVWYLFSPSTGAAKGVQWGTGQDVMVPGDYDGDGKSDVAVFRQANGVWYLVSSITGRTEGIQWGGGSDRPVPADYNGDGRTDLAVFRPSDGVWYVRYSGTDATAGFQWGSTQDVPVAGDYNGDGKADLAVFRPANGTWYIWFTGGGQMGFQWGSRQDVAVPADYDGDGATDIAVFRPSNGTWYFRYSATGNVAGFQWGAAGDEPVPGDYDGDSLTDLAVFRKPQGIWYIWQTSTNSPIGVQWGSGEDVPVVKGSR